ncbi:Piwi-domain-containing protein [Rhizophagus irregularis]|uniref:Piwi-domain-containing protein n=1 Tax=Rhizophagus irregularis TaxID=588596 RepID=A0A2N0NWU6_9GLOM|nr:Piwi-domain-containing protein [Rhizophagus irregularis]
MEKETFQIIKRPGIGNKGEPIKVRANFFEVTKMQKTKIIHYDVTIKPEVKLEEGNVPVARKRPPEDFRITIRKARDIDMEDLFQFLFAKSRMTENCQMAITAMDIIISHEISAKYPTVRNSFYTPQGARSLFGGIEAWQGYYQSARPARGKMMINIDLSATAFYEEGPLIRMVAKILGLRSPNDLRKGLSDKDRQKVEKRIKNLKIRDNHNPENKRKFKIEKLTKTPASHTTFDKDGSRIDVKTYFQNQFNKRLIYPFLPCVVVRKTVYLPLEVCDVIPEQRYMRKLDKNLTDEMMKFTRQNPNVRANKIHDGLNILNYKGNEYLKQFGMEVSRDMAVVNARILPTPTIQYHQSSREHRVRPNGGAWNLRDKKVANGATLSSWSVMVFSNYKHLPDQAIKFFNILDRDPPICRGNPIGNIEESLNKAYLNAKEKARVIKPQLILCILPNAGPELYAEIKRISETAIGVATQCIQSIHMKNPKKQYCANVCLKMNVKLGGENSFLIPEHIQFLIDDPTILMGADVTHPTATADDESPSYAALCGSMNVKASRYAASLRVQTGGTEIIIDLENMVKESLKAFYQTCGLKPKKILFYRDGVSESQFMEVLECELTAIRAACRSLETSYKPNITFVVVQKRHHTRLFPIHGGDRTGNCIPGTVVDMDITHPFEFDFYLLSHAGLLGTSRPAHYRVLYDENGFDANRLQMLSYNLCYVYARCTRAVSLVPPVYYAHLAAARAKIHSPYRDTDTESSKGDKSTATTIGEVKGELRKVMYFM